MVGHVDLWEARNKRAFLLTPREEFCIGRDRAVIYDVNYHDIGFGVTITGPRVVGRMTSSIDVKMGEKVLEIGTGSGYQSAYLANLTDKVWTIEIIKPLAERTRGVYDALIERGYTEFKAITSKSADGYYGWEESGPVRQDHRHLRHRPHSPAAAAAAQDRRHHGDPGRAAGGAAYPQGRQGDDRERPGRRQALRHLCRQAGAVRRPSPSCRATASRGRTTSDSASAARHEESSPCKLPMSKTARRSTAFAARNGNSGRS